MVLDAVFGVTGDVEVEVVPEGVLVRIQSGGTKWTFACSRHRALAAAGKLRRAIDAAEVMGRVQRLHGSGHFQPEIVGADGTIRRSEDCL